MKKLQQPLNFSNAQKVLDHRKGYFDFKNVLHTKKLILKTGHFKVFLENLKRFFIGFTVKNPLGTFIFKYR